MSFGGPRYPRRSSRGNDLQIGLLVRMIPIIFGVCAVGFTMVRGCQQGPFGRVQVVAMNPAQEAKLGLQAFREVLSDAQVVRQGPAASKVREIAERLIEATSNESFQKLVGTPIPDFDWQLEVVHDRQVNAFCLPGGKIVVYTAILPVAETDAGLATVVGHEIAHALAHHGAERMAQQQMVQIGLVSASASMGDMDASRRQQLLSVLNAGAKFGILSYSRKHESEADHMGLLLMAAAGYDPKESIRFWERMTATTGGGQAPPEFMSTHPNHQTRIRDLTRWMPEAEALYQRSPLKSRTEVLPEH
ncbi:M48 family metallopeptidase [Schlesneria sp. DSM 10557]|uniref:M48 family metallopeptidase n=1 Tax=Schlesneria sp. DSM 10557 TaxID=3044399 RepID=UPI0035A1439A